MASTQNERTNGIHFIPCEQYWYLRIVPVWYPTVTPVGSEHDGMVESTGTPVAEAMIVCGTYLWCHFGSFCGLARSIYSYIAKISHKIRHDETKRKTNFLNDTGKWWLRARLPCPLNVLSNTQSSCTADYFIFFSYSSCFDRVVGILWPRPCSVYV